MKEQLRNIPSVNELLESSQISRLLKDHDRVTLKAIIIEKINLLREEIVFSNPAKTHVLTKEEIKSQLINQLDEELALKERKRIQKVINATGIVLHTNLGRAPLPKKAIEKIRDTVSGYCNLEYDLIQGERGSRYESVEELITELTGAESALIVNNNAAAVFLCLHTLASEKEVIVSRSEQVEIGGSFRIPDIINRSGAKMIEVGTTNKTYIKDYEDAVTENTSVFLKVHKSNYKIEGFTREVQGKELVDLAKMNDVIVMEDVGSGVLIDLSEYNLPYEPTVCHLVSEGIDIVTFSGDKLLGGPQAGIIVGRRELIGRIKGNPLTRMVRIDKLSLIALQEVLSLYRDKENVIKLIPILSMLTKTQDELLIAANQLKALINHKLEDLEVNTIEEEDSTGGGALPGTVIQGIALAIECAHVNANRIQKRLREYTLPIIVRVKEDKVILSMRTISQGDYHHIVQGLGFAFSKEERN
ncbi:L-seryl-tRNA(Sec) selenium transferase [Vallitalea okinawensis]|uniref:L-seryl-tRNA(Sec) selenium transferase n=1 Tax=Vallitalea okinawensis TaxID=2078660 RepID=UPI000CFDD0FD|nr:L-seryl-tRNA(Sec) selenium transferase [Vallitalea okinawensis]